MNREQARQIMAIGRKVWSCGVFDSGAHNGARCTPEDPHGGWWRCGYKYKFTADAEVVEKIAAYTTEGS